MLKGIVVKWQDIYATNKVHERGQRFSLQQAENLPTLFSANVEIILKVMA